MALIECVQLSRYDIRGILGSGADYEVRSAVERDTGREVVLKRPEPQMVQRQLHAKIEARTDRLLEARQALGTDLSTVVPILGYTERANHDDFFGESYGQDYRVIIEERALGIPLVGDIKARIRRVPIGVGQNLFTLFPLISPENVSPFTLLEQLLDVEEAFVNVGYLLLDLRPQNIFYQPATGHITVIDCGALANLSHDDATRTSRQSPQDLHDFYLEMIKFYATPQPPPTQAAGYRDPYGLRPVVDFARELDQMARDYQAVDDTHVQDTALTLIHQIHDRAYTAFADFRRDLTDYLEAVAAYHQALPNLPEARAAWGEALTWLREDYWQHFLFDPNAELAALHL